VKLDVFEENYVYRIAWDDDGCPGLYVGERRSNGLWKPSCPPPEDRDDWEIWMTEQAAAFLKPDGRDDHSGYFWESKSAALAALRTIKAALKQERPLPEWAKTALAHGWKAPKGWKA
jgi:hypothetical protein